MTTKQLNKLVALWQKRLRIQDWDIQLSLHTTADMNAMGHDDVWGICFVESYKKRAMIKMLYPQEINGTKDTFETVLVHEMLHIFMPGLDLKINLEEDSAEYKLYERIIDQMSHILVDAYNGKN